MVYWFCIHFDETIDIPDEVQLIVFCRVADEKTNTNDENYLYCLKNVGVCTTAQAIFAKLKQFIVKYGLVWTKCKSVATDGEAVIQGSSSGLVRKIKNVSRTVLQLIARFIEKHLWLRTISGQV